MSRTDFLAQPVPRVLVVGPITAGPALHCTVACQIVRIDAPRARAYLHVAVGDITGIRIGDFGQGVVPEQGGEYDLVRFWERRA